MSAVEIKVNDNAIEDIVNKQIDKIINSQLDGVTWSLDQFRKFCCGGKAKEWVTLYVLSEFADEIDYHQSGGWLVPSRGRGTKNVIFAKSACEWMEKNRLRIDWEGKLER